MGRAGHFQSLRTRLILTHALEVLVRGERKASRKQPNIRFRGYGGHMPKRLPSARSKANKVTTRKRKPPTTKAAAKASRPKPSRAQGRATATEPMLKKIAFTLLSIEDAARARAFYEDVLGLRRGLASPDGVWTEYDLPQGGCLALFRHPDPSFVRKPGGASVAFEVSNLDALNKRLKRAGVEYQGDIVHGPRCRMSNIVDSEGNAIILHELSK